MPFSSIVFLFYFLPCFLVLYALLPWKNTVLLAASLLFYGWGEPRYVPLLLLFILINYGFGLLLESRRDRAKAVLAVAIAINLGLIGVFKYLDFLAGDWNWLADRLGLPGLPKPGIALPLGISFFTFQGISYLIDVYRGTIPAQRSLLRFATYKAMFPQLIAGPIVRYREVAAELADRRMTGDRIALGLQYFAVGLAQKVLLANTLAVPADQMFGLPAGQLTTAGAWFGLVCYMLQIYFDFGGYSNMAIGLAHMMGLTFPRNFDRPYAALSVTEFWRRWHMTLSSWFRDYLYIPLGGNRGPAWRTYANLLAVFFLCGLWHGASWNFVIWGLYHGAFLIAERAGLSRVLDRSWRPLRHLYLWLAVMIGWVFFRADTLDQALGYLSALSGLSAGDPILAPLSRHAGNSVIAALICGVVLAVAPVARLEKLAESVRLRPMLQTASVVLFLCAAFSLASGTYNPFIYFRF